MVHILLLFLLPGSGSVSVGTVFSYWDDPMAPLAVLVSRGLFCETYVSLCEICSFFPWFGPGSVEVSLARPRSPLMLVLMLFVPGVRDLADAR